MIDSNPDYLYSRCSICFDSSLDFCLKKCRDQFCTDCFSLYVQEIIHSSWGLQVATIKCPVCSEVVSYHEWTQYVHEHLIDLYDKLNQPFKIMSRSCNVCTFPVNCLSEKSSIQTQNDCFREISDESSNESDVDSDEDVDSTEVIAPSISNSSVSLRSKFTALQDSLKNLLTLDGQTLSYYSKTTLDIFERNSLNHLEGGYMSIMFIYKTLMTDLGTALNFKLDKHAKLVIDASKNAFVLPDLLSKSQYKALLMLSRDLIALEHKAEVWMQMQFIHVNNFPKMWCGECGEDLCFSCGIHPYHQNLSCDEHARIQHALLSKEEQATLEWTLRNSKKCPNCSIRISRDEGCHKVDCVYCGFSFCWMCLNPFEAAKCGFYACQERPSSSEIKGPRTKRLKNTDDGNETQTESDNEDGAKGRETIRPERGVPNINKIHRLSHHRQL